MSVKRRWRKAKRARRGDYNVVDGKVPWYTALIRFIRG